MIDLLKTRKKLKKKFKKRELIFACWLSYPELSIVETFCSLNIDLLASIDNASIKIKKNKEKKYSIFVNKITYALAENLCIRTRSRETACNISTN